jgi:PAS domain-containing protein
MTSGPGKPPDPARVLSGLEPVLAAESVETLLERATQLLNTLTQAHATAIFVTDGANVVHEAWQPGNEARRARLRPHFLGLTRQSVEVGEPVAFPFPTGIAPDFTPHVFLIQARGRVVGTVCCACKPGDEADRAELRAIVEPLVRLVAQRLGDLSELSSSRVTRAQYERWFRQLDSHIRTLDRERQKFAAVVNQSDVYIYVADATRTIRWANRAIGARFPLDPNGTSWIGRSCGDLCARFGEAECNGTCPITRALESNQAAHEEFEQDDPDGKRSLYATALPIKGPEGRPHEVIVMVQDLSEIETVRKSEARYRALFEERRRAEEALGRLELRLSTVIASSPIVLFSVDREGIFTLSEGRGLQALGLEPGKAVGQSAFELYRDIPAVVANIRRALVGEEFSAMVEVGDASFDTHYAPLRDASGTITGVLGVATVLTNARRPDRRAA